jgi:hypothetical protein
VLVARAQPGIRSASIGDEATVAADRDGAVRRGLAGVGAQRDDLEEIDVDEPAVG